jgi:hypothetical protein
MIRSGDAAWQDAVEAFRNYEDLLQSFREGARKKFFGIELRNDPAGYSDEDLQAIYPGSSRENFDSSAGIADVDEETNQLIGQSVVMVLLPHVQVLRKAARIFVVDTRIAVFEQDADRAVQDIETMLGLARHAAEGPVLVCSLVGYAIAGIAFDQIEEILTGNPGFFNDQQLARIQQAVTDAEIRQWLRYEGERYMVADMIQRVYTDDGEGDGRITPEGLKILVAMNMWMQTDRPDFNDSRLSNLAQSVIGPASLLVAASRKEVTDRAGEILDALMADADRPYWQAKHPDVEEMLGDDRMKYALLHALLPAAQQVRSAMDRIAGRKEGVIGALALYRQHLSTGKWPESWDAVPRKVLAQPPVDQFNGQPLRFRIVDDQPRIFSTGEDRDYDGGKDLVHLHNGRPVEYVDRTPIYFGPPNPDPSRFDGDWIVWPQGNRN